MYHHRFDDIGRDFPGLEARIRSLSVCDFDFSAMVEDYMKIATALRHSAEGSLGLSAEHCDELQIIHGRMRNAIRARLMSDQSAI
ncbi:MAG: hypothetical protein EBU97_03105 [Rhodobacteraceae bacterium]|nr:hypothetical protein [Paracoccaceae bacterium]